MFFSFTLISFNINSVRWQIFINPYSYFSFGIDSYHILLNIKKSNFLYNFIECISCCQYHIQIIGVWNIFNITESDKYSFCIYFSPAHWRTTFRLFSDTEVKCPCNILLSHSPIENLIILIHLIFIGEF